jgi:hypothetical protein
MLTSLPYALMAYLHLRRHKLTEHEGVRYACDQCGAEFTAQGNLRRHKLSKHEQVTAVRITYNYYSLLGSESKITCNALCMKRD